MSTVKTAKGTELPLLNLKGKQYLMVAYRLQWLSEDVPNYRIDTNLVRSDENSATVAARVTIFDSATGKLSREALAHKTETKTDFNDFLEKAETAAVGRALAMLGFGTQHALADLDEGTRIVDTPLAKASGAFVPKPSAGVGPKKENLSKTEKTGF
jgi:hypothetical protein